MQIENEFSTASEEMISNLEQKIGFKLPKEYKKFILLHNGGYPTPNKFVFTDFRGETSDSLIEFLLPIGDGLDNNIGMVYEYFTGEERLPIGMLPIAYDPFGNMVCISLKDEDYGSLYFWDHEWEFEDNNISLIASSFEQLVNMLN